MVKLHSKINDPAIYLLAVSLLGTVFILLAQLNVYKYILSGMFFELLWLPILLSLIVIPVTSIIIWIKKGWRIRSLEFAAIVTSAINLLLLFTI